MAQVSRRIPPVTEFGGCFGLSVRARPAPSCVTAMWQERINRVFADAQRLLLVKALSDELPAQLNRELSAGRTSG